MPTTLNFKMAVPIPLQLSPSTVVATLQRYEPLITPNPYLKSFRARPLEVDEIVNDDFFREDGHQIAAFEVVDRIVLVPGLARKEIKIPCVMQRFEGGVRSRALAPGGVRVWSTWTVAPRSAASGPSVEEGGTPGQWELVEEARVECSPMVKMFVGRTFESGHREILKKIVAEIAQTSPPVTLNYPSPLAAAAERDGRATPPQVPGPQWQVPQQAQGGSNPHNTVQELPG